MVLGTTESPKTRAPSGEMPRALVALVVGFTVVVAVLLGQWAFVSNLDARVTDIFVRGRAPDLVPSPEITIAMVDELGVRSLVLSEDGEPMPWPWPRSTWAVLAMHLKELGA